MVAITSFLENQLGDNADYVVKVRDRTQIAEERDYFSCQIAGIHEPIASPGTIFDIACQISLDSLVLELTHKLGV